ncbi:uncharacterized protein LOC141527241 [Cotesia typhae]|uniref:uncharacterized protein LOC141527241 n=1 Tax=Cotesia typhae TaxID=2053667 RepID=UPI003D68100D
MESTHLPTIRDFSPEVSGNVSDSSVSQGIFMYDSNEDYSECDDSESSDTELSDYFLDSDDDLDERIQREITVDSQINFDDNENACAYEVHQVSSKITYPESMLIRTLLILSVKIKKNLDNESVQLITELVDALSDESLNYNTLYHFKKIIDSYSYPFEIHYLCPTCGLYIGVKVITEEESTLKCQGCNVDILLKTNKQSPKFFLYSPLSRQLQDFCVQHHEKLLYPVEREKKCSYAIEDIMDGKLYNLHRSTEDSLSLNFSVDGTLLFKSSQTSITPVLWTINELPPQERKQHITLASICLGQKKPDMNNYSTPFVEECQKLANEGVTYTFNGYVYNKKVRVLVGVCDSVERPNLRCSKTFRGEYGCGLCKHPGEEISKGAGHVWVYPIDAHGNAFGEGLRSHIETATHADSQEKGIKGRSVLFGVPDFDIIKNLAVDWMHCVPLGVCRQFLKLWFDSQYHDKPFYLGNVINDIDFFITSIRPSSDISRTPRKISDRLHLKAHELVIWLLFYSLPSLKTYLPPQYLKHWSLLVEAISILLKTSVFKTEVYYAQQCFFQFVVDVETLYGPEHVSFNVHLLTHLPESVLNWGPLWTHSAFCYENFHQLLKKLVKNSNSADLQILESLRSAIALHKLEKCFEYHLTTRQRKFLKKVINKKRYSNYSMKIGEIKMIGKGLSTQIPTNHSLALRRLNIEVDNDTDVQYFKRIIINNEVIHSRAYTRVQKRNNFSVLLLNKEIFEIDIFLLAYRNGEKECYAL